MLVGCGAGRSPATTQASPAPAELATQIDRAQQTIDDASATAAELREAARTEQLAFGELADRRHLRRATLARLSPSARSAAQAALRAAVALTRIVPSEHRFPKWRIVPPPPPSRLLGYFQAAGATYDIPWQYLAAVELVETRMGRIRGLSPAGARGPMQFEPAT